VIKKLDILIIRSFIGPFIAALVISLFVLTMQFFWLYIDDLVGKGLDLLVILKLLGLVVMYGVPLALPLALLFSSIMTFGNLGETFELVAIKAAGIPLLRFMRPLSILTLFISGLAFLFANNVRPYVELKLSALKYDIIVSKPAFDIKEGVFYDKIEGYVIKLGKKEKNDSVIRNVVIFEKNRNYLQDNMLVAESGVMRLTPDKRFIEFTLKNGWRYEESGQRSTTNTQFTRMGFKEYKKNFDLSSFKLKESGDSVFYDPKMLSIRQLNTAIDSLHNVDSFYLLRTSREVGPYLRFSRYSDTGWTAVNDTLLKKAKDLSELIPDSLETRITDASINQLNSIKGNLAVLSDDYHERYKNLLLHEIEWHKKLTLSVACFVMFLIGAPLGSIIRKGGLGAPLVFAIIFFVVFHLFNTFGEKFVKSETMSPFMGMWLSTVILIPIGIFLTYKAMRDSQLLNKEFYYRSFKKMRGILANFKAGKKSS
jgi:lipopolysaccharide export system permease protein